MAACDYAWIIEVRELTKKDKEGAKAKTAFTWTEAARSAFATLKHLFTVALSLVHFHPEKSTVIETDASDWALGAVPSQIQETKRLHIRWHITRGNSSHYDAHNKELLAIVTAFRQYTRSVAGFQGALAMLRAPRSAGWLERLQT
jgi:hypothetical protein